jgi:hypothetical protein
MIDQSQSINGSDPTGARLFSAKAFLEGLSPNDWVLLSAFADEGGNTDAQIPDPAPHSICAVPKRRDG